jgi:hypothetical protein
MMSTYVNKVYPLDPDKVNATVRAKVKNYEEMLRLGVINAISLMKKWKTKPTDFCRRPTSPIKVRKMYNSWIDLEYNHYAKVRVVRIGARKYVLVYGDVDNATVESGTGPFKTLTKAQEWFFNQGR